MISQVECFAQEPVDCAGMRVTAVRGLAGMFILQAHCGVRLIADAYTDAREDESLRADEDLFADIVRAYYAGGAR